MKNAIVLIGLSFISLNSFAISKLVCTAVAVQSTSSRYSGTSTKDYSGDNGSFYSKIDGTSSIRYYSGSSSSSSTIGVAVEGKDQAVLSVESDKQKVGTVVTVNPEALNSAAGATMTLKAFDMVVVTEIKAVGNQQVSVKMSDEKLDRQSDELLSKDSSFITLSDGNGSRINLTCQF